MSTQQQKIRLKIPTARSKLQSQFPAHLNSDIKIIVGKKVFQLQKAFLRLESSYFKRKFLPQVSILNIDQSSFDQTHFENVLKCFYGMTIQIKRSQVLQYYPIIKFLQIECLLKYLCADMIKSITNYDLFLLMRLAHQYNQEDIFESCLNELEKENYEQMNYSRFELLKCKEELFKLIVKTHNRAKNEGHKGLSYVEIDQIIKEFCEEKNMAEGQYHQMKFELIDKQALTSLEYKQIFLDEVKNVKKSFIGSSSFIKSQPNGFMFGTQGGLSSMVKPTNLTQSMIQPNALNIKSPMVSNQLTLQMQNTFQKKLNQELKLQNQTLKQELQKLKVASQQNLKFNEQLKKLLGGIEELVKEKEDEDKKQKEHMLIMEKTIAILRGQLEEKGDLMKRLEEKVAKIQKNAGNKKYVVDSDEQDQEQNTIQSQIVPAHLIGQMMPAKMRQEQSSQTFKKKPPPTVEAKRVQQPQPQQQLDDQDLQQMYTPRLAFTQQPLGTPKKYLPVLADLITQEGWNKKRLTPVYRRSSQGHSPLGTPSSLRQCNQLLILIKTQQDQFIGGYITVQLPLNISGQYIEDRGAFLFSLTKKQKFMIEKSEISQAVFLSDSYLISFGNDLLIAMECTKQKSQCNWPASYKSDSQHSNPEWLIGEKSPFFIKQIQVYEVEQAEMEMVL